MDQASRAASNENNAADSTDAGRTFHRALPTLPQASLGFRAAVAVAGGLTSVALLGAVVLGLTSMADRSTGASTVVTTPLVDPDTATAAAGGMRQEALATSPLCPVDRVSNPGTVPATQVRSPDGPIRSLALACKTE